MTELIREQLILELVSVILGIVMAVTYDIIRVLRLIVKHSEILKCTQDLVYWLFYSGVTYYVFLKYNYGGVRMYAIGVIFASLLIYHSTISVLFINYCVKALKFVYKPIKLIAISIKKKRGHINDKGTEFCEEQPNKTKYCYGESEQTQQIKKKK